VKFGCCLNANAVSAGKTGAETITYFRELGYDYMELSLAQVTDLGEAEFKDLLRGLREGGLAPEACNGFLPGTLRLTGDAADPGAALEYIKRACGRAAEMGAEIIVLGSSGAKNIPPGFPYEKARTQFLDLLRHVQAIVQPLGITVVLEPLNRAESNFITTGREGLALVREAALDNVKLLIDYYHMRMEDEDLSVIADAGEDLRHLHLATKEGRAFPHQGDGEDYPAFFAALKKAGYRGRISIEAHSQDLFADARSARNIILPLLR
jgi:sugar phosphate isomerase/epimerase